MGRNTDKQTDTQESRRTDKLIISRQTEGQAKGRTIRQAKGRTEGQAMGRTEGRQRNGHMDGQKGKQRDRQ